MLKRFSYLFFLACFSTNSCITHILVKNQGGKKNHKKPNKSLQIWFKLTPYGKRKLVFFYKVCKVDNVAQ